MPNMKIAFPLSAVAMSISLFALGVGAAGPEPGVNVTVTNPPTQPVPVTGTVTVSNGTPLSVTVTTSATPVAFLMSSSGGDPGKPPNIVAVPSNRRLTIEYISGVCHPNAAATGFAIKYGGHGTRCND